MRAQTWLRGLRFISVVAASVACRDQTDPDQRLGPRRAGGAIDESVARALIAAEEYRAAERVTGARGSGAIACEMGLPRWGVAGYREGLCRGR